MTEPSVLARASTTLRSLLPERLRGETAAVPVVRLSGVIGRSIMPFASALSLSSCAPTLDRAFATRGAKAVALVINSPGGSAVQSHLIFKRIRALSDEKKLPVLAFVEDVAASGGYMIACAADEIIADPSSIVGSIGVVGGSFGFHRLLDKIGIERRLYTSGDNKAMLDPFLPEKPEDVERLKAIQKEIHELFIALVKSRRGERLKGPADRMFSGEFWTGPTALDYGVIDGFGDVRSTLRARFGDKVKMPVIGAEKSFIARRLFGSAAAGAPVAGLAEDIAATATARALWARYGL